MADENGDGVNSEKKHDWTVRAERLHELGFADYEAYLKSEHWNKLRTDFLKRENIPEFCWGCRTPVWIVRLIYHQYLNVHHLKYERLGKEEFNDLVILCRRCHELEHHKKSQLPKINLVPCEFGICFRPMVKLSPPLSELTFRVRGLGEPEAIGDIVLRTLKQSTPSWTQFEFSKIVELTTHPLCKAEDQQRQIKSSEVFRTSSASTAKRRAELQSQAQEILKKYPRKSTT